MENKNRISLGGKKDVHNIFKMPQSLGGQKLKSRSSSRPFGIPPLRPKPSGSQYSAVAHSPRMSDQTFSSMNNPNKSARNEFD